VNNFLQALAGGLRSAQDLGNTLGSGLIAQPVSGIAGLTELLRSRDLNKAADTVRSVQDRMTIKPRSEASARTLELATLPFTALDEHVIRPISDKAADVGGPAAGTAVNVALNMLDPSRVGMGAKRLGRGARTRREGVPPLDPEMKWVKLADTTDNRLPLLESREGPSFKGAGDLSPPEGGLLDVNYPAHHGFVAEWIYDTTGQVPTDAMVRQAIAQHNAMLPVKQGGLGLGPNNTSLERAAALDYTVPSYHASLHSDIEAYDPTRSQGGYAGPGFYSSASPVDVTWGYGTPFSLEGHQRLFDAASHGNFMKRNALEDQHGDLPLDIERQLVADEQLVNDFSANTKNRLHEKLDTEYPVPGRWNERAPLRKEQHSPRNIKTELFANDPSTVESWVQHGVEGITPADLEVAAQLQALARQVPEEMRGMPGMPNVGDSLGTVYPLLLRNDESLDLSDFAHRNAQRNPEQKLFDQYEDRLDDPDNLMLDNGKHVALSEDGVAHIVHTPDPSWVRGLNMSPEHRITIDPSAIRSRFAAFDPAQRKSPNILAFKGGQKPDFNKMLAQKLRESAVNVLAENKETEQ
jgi:hypothetical protein